MSQETEINLLKETQTVKSKIVDACIDAAKQGEVEFDFRYYYDTFLMFAVTADFKGVEFFSYDEQSSGVRLQASWLNEGGEKLIINFGLQDAMKFRSMVAILAKENPVVKRIRRIKQAADRKSTQERIEEQRQTLHLLNKIKESLTPS